MVVPNNLFGPLDPSTRWAIKWSGAIGQNKVCFLAQEKCYSNLAIPKSCRINLFHLLSIYSGVSEAFTIGFFLDRNLWHLKGRTYCVHNQAIPECDVHTECWNSYQHEGLWVRNVDIMTDWHMGWNGCYRIPFWTISIGLLKIETRLRACGQNKAGRRNLEMVLTYCTNSTCRKNDFEQPFGCWIVVFKWKQINRIVLSHQHGQQ